MGEQLRVYARYVLPRGVIGFTGLVHVAVGPAAYPASADWILMRVMYPHMVIYLYYINKNSTYRAVITQMR